MPNDNNADVTTEITKSTKQTKSTENQTKKETKAVTEAETPTSEIAVTTTAKEIDEIDKIISEMSIEEKVGQVILARCTETAAEDMKKYQFGGFTLYAVDFENETKSSVKEKIQNIQNNAKIPAFIAVDEEGGNVVRVSKFTAFRDSRFKSPQQVLKSGDDALINDTIEKNKLLLSLGINFNLAPVADVTPNSTDYIYDRTFGLDAKETGEKVAMVVSEMNKSGIASCLKHFPGYGTNIDTHTGIATDTRSKSQFKENDFIPFEYGIEADCPAVLVSHNIINAYDDKFPASLSAKMHEILRDELDFGGVIMTDDLGMDAITLYSGDESVYVLAVLAGNDLLCTTDSVKCYEDILSAVNTGKITEKRLDESIRRILEMKTLYSNL